jgi:NDP-hexose-3-ketoreductase
VPHLNFGVLGAAQIARKYMLDAIKNVPHCKWHSIASRDYEKAKEIASKNQVQAFANYQELINSPEVDVIYIPLPNGLHYEWAIWALEKGKHVFCEKSLTGNLKHSLELINLAKSNKLIIAENFMCSEHAQNILVRNLLQKNEIGALKSIHLSFGFPPLAAGDIRYNLSLEGGALNDVGAYTLFMGSFFTQSPVVSLYAVLGNEKHEVDIEGSILVEYQNGTCGNFNFGFNHDYKNQALFWGSNGQIIIDRAFSIPPDRKPDIKKVVNNELTSIESSCDNHFENILKSFSAAILSNQYDFYSEQLTTQALLLEATRVSSRETRVVHKSEIDSWRIN